MATYFSEVAKKAKEMLPSRGLSDPSFNQAGLVVSQVEILVDPAIAIGDTIVLTQELCRGMALIPALCRFYADSGSSGVKVDIGFKVGDEEVTDRYFKEIGFETPASEAQNAIAPASLSGMGYGVDFVKPAMCLDGKPLIATVMSVGAAPPAGSVIMATLVFASVA